ncbi:bile acid:sodium symporter family protein [Singulisphaera sp. PoT]|uniref:bile acid:sodium symporter family protein n=1 Tax=Singulisphaera sp. PoT TaxID=3411797 RepID=UPI003BF47B80
MKWKSDWFLIGMLVAVGLACVVPGPGAHGGFLHPEILNKAGVALIFFLHGVALSFDALKAGTLRWPLHLLVQGCTFLFFPILGLGMLWLAGRWLAPDLRLGFFYLCALPSTVSSSVAMTAAARGNVPVAVFNATLSSLLGVLLTPFWMGTVADSGGHPLPLGKVVLDLCLWLLVPLAVGQLCRPWLGSWIARHKSRVNVVDRVTILVLVYTSFCDSVVEGVWTGNGLGTVLATVIGVMVLFAIVLTGTILACDALKIVPGDRAAVVFCGSKKTLASGVPMAQLMFGNHPGLSLILLPIMIYHPLQLVVCGILAGRWARHPISPPTD